MNKKGIYSVAIGLLAIIVAIFLLYNNYSDINIKEKNYGIEIVKLKKLWQNLYYLDNNIFCENQGCKDEIKKINDEISKKENIECKLKWEKEREGDKLYCKKEFDDFLISYEKRIKFSR